MSKAAFYDYDFKVGEQMSLSFRGVDINIERDSKGFIARIPSSNTSSFACGASPLEAVGRVLINNSEIIDKR